MRTRAGPLASPDLQPEPSAARTLAYAPAGARYRVDAPAGVGNRAARALLARELGTGTPRVPDAGDVTDVLVTSPTDAVEQQAAAVAEQTRSGGDSVVPAATGLARSAAPGQSTTGLPPLLQGALTGGRALTGDQRAPLESALGADLTALRVHTGAPAATAARALGARAFTLGSSVVLGAGESVTDLPLMAHEATHVLQRPTGLARWALGGAVLILRDPGGATAAPPAPAAAPAAPAAPARINMTFGWLAETEVERNDQVAGLARLAIASLTDELADVQGADVRTAASAWIARIRGVLPYFDRHGPEPVDAAMIPLINGQIEELGRIRQAIQQDRIRQVLAALADEHRAAERAAAEAEALQPALDDAMRAAFRQGSSNALRDAVSTVKGALSTGRNLRSLAFEITRDMNNLLAALSPQRFAGLGAPPSGVRMAFTVDDWSSQLGRVRVSVTITDVNRYSNMLATLGRGLSLINIALTAGDRSQRATSAEQGMKDLNDAVGLSTDLASLSSFSLPPHFTLYNTLWIKPAMKVITQNIGVIIGRLSDVNRVSVEVTGDLMYPNAEPGGQAMFDFMIAVMHATDVGGVPPITGRIREYLYDHREALGIGAEQEVPTEGMLFWRDLHSVGARTWLFTNRGRVWAMFYGSMPVPNRP